MDKRKKTVILFSVLALVAALIFPLIRYKSITSPIQETSYDPALECKSSALLWNLDSIDNSTGFIIPGWIYLQGYEPKKIRYSVWLKEKGSSRCLILTTETMEREDVAKSATDGLNHTLSGFCAAVSLRNLDLDTWDYEIIIQYACDDRNYLVPTGIFLRDQLLKG